MPKLFSLDGKEMDEFDAYNAKNGNADYRIEDIRFGGSELIGKRRSQEDRMFGYAFEEEVAPVFENLSPGEQQAVIEDTFRIMNKKIEAELGGIHFQGSTAIIAVILPKQMRVISASLGDAQVFAVVLDNQGKLKKVQELNNIHQPSAPLEKQRLQAFAKSRDIPEQNCVSHNRLGGTLAVSGAFGDLGYVKYGLRHDPDIKDDHFLLEAGERLFVIPCCDGLTERNYITLNDIGCFIEAQRNQQPGMIATLLAQEALNRGSGDNVSAQVAEMTSAVNQTDSTPLMLGIFDGHGGNKVSQFLKNEFTRSFITALAEIAPELKKILENDYDSIPGTPVLDTSEDDQSNPDVLQEDIEPIELNISPVTALPMPAFSAHLQKQTQTDDSVAMPTHRYDLRDRSSIKRPKY